MVEGIEPRKLLVGSDDAVCDAEVNTGIGGNGKLVFGSPGSVTMACRTL